MYFYDKLSSNRLITFSKAECLAQIPITIDDLITWKVSMYKNTDKSIYLKMRLKYFIINVLYNYFKYSKY